MPKTMKEKTDIVKAPNSEAAITLFKRKHPGATVKRTRVISKTYIVVYT